MMAATPRHVVFGTGAIALAPLDALRRRGETVRLVNRSGTAPVPDDVEVLGGDASDPAFTAAAAQGAQVVYQTLNPPYHQWVELFPALQASVLAAAQATGARLVSMENLYMYGRPAGQPLTETRPMPPTPRKARCAPAWPASSWPPTRPAGSRWPSAGPRTTSAPRRRPVHPRRPGHPGRPGRQDRQRPGRS
jgi:nucleoside-diphosphate-sugar epimerase